MAKIGKFLDSLGRRLEENRDGLIFFDCFLKNNLVRELDNRSIRSGLLVNLETNFADKQSWGTIYQIVAEILFNAALREHSEVHPDIFNEADSVSLTFCQVAKEQLGFDMEFIPIKSPMK